MTGVSIIECHQLNWILGLKNVEDLIVQGKGGLTGQAASGRSKYSVQIGGGGGRFSVLFPSMFCSILKSGRYLHLSLSKS
jgi:hypothetical protein